MKAHRKDGKIIVEIDEEALVTGGEFHPETPYRVTDRESFLDHIVEQIPDIGDDGDNHSCTDLARLLDRCTEDAVMSGRGAIQIEDSDSPNAELSSGGPANE